MIRLSWLAEQEAMLIIVILMAGMALAAEVAFLAGRRWHTALAGDIKTHFGALRIPLLGLVSLLLGFSFAMAGQRHEVRRQLVIEDASHLRSLYMWSRLLEVDEREDFQKLLRQYVAIRSDQQLVQCELSAREVADLLARSDLVFQQMWDQAMVIQGEKPGRTEVEEILKLLIASLDVHNRRIQAYVSRVPDHVLWLLFGTAVVALTAVGFSSGLLGRRSILARVLIIAVISGTVFVVLEMDRPGRGALKVDQGPMNQLKQVLDRDGELSEDKLPGSV